MEGGGEGPEGRGNERAENPKRRDAERKTVVIENLLAATPRTAHARSINRGDRESGGF